jgi:outer membrane receptor protein involved in Fe transport
MRLRIATVLSFATFAILILSAIAVAQTSKGTITGTVTDPSGASVANVTITARGLDNGETRTVTTGNYGEYRITAILPGIYEVKADSQGFGSVVMDHVDVKASVETPLDFQLQVRGASQSIVVEASSSAVQSESAELSASISGTDIKELPIISLNPISLVLTEPGVVSVADRDSFTNGAGFSVDGLRPRSNNFLIDGFDNNDNGIQGQAIQPQNLEAVSEVVIQTNSYAPEFGRGGGSVTNVIYASGTNNWHGAVWERYNGSGFNAITADQHRNGLATVPRTVENTPGFRVGGPIAKNKLFVFGSYQLDHLRGDEQGAQITIPTAAGVATLQSLGANQNVQTLLNSLNGLVAPSADPKSISTIAIGDRPGCGTGCTVEVGTFARQAPQISNAYEYVIRGDYLMTPKDTISVRWLASHNSLTPDLFANPNALPGTDTEQSGPSRSLGAFWTHVINDHIVNELRFTRQTLNFGFDPLASTLANPFVNLPDIEVAELSGVDFGGLTLGFPQDRDHTVYQYQEALSVTHGHHSFKVGADIAHLGITDGVPFNSRGTLTYNSGGDCSAIGLSSCTGLANFFDDFSGDGGTASKQFGVSQVSYTQLQQSYYAQDTWKVRPNVSLTYGLRYEFQGTPFNTLPFPTVNASTALTDPLSLRVPEKPDRNNFGPRLGIAYTPKFMPGLFGQDKTAIRAGFGMFYDVLFANILDNTASSTPNVTGGTVIASVISPTGDRGQADFSSVIPSITPTLSPFDSVTTAVSNLRNPLTYQWNLSVERELPGSWLVTAAYVGTRGERLFLNQELNPGVNSVRLNPDRGGIFARTNNGDSIYHGLQTKAEHRFGRGVLFRAAYTFSKSIDNGSEVFVTSGGSTRAQDQFSNRGDRGLSAFDRRHRAAFTWVWDPPGVHGDSGYKHALGYAVNGWEVSGTAQFETGAPETIHVENFDVNGDLSGANDRPSVGNLSVPINYSAACLNPAGHCDTGVGISQDGVHFADFNSSFGVNPGPGPSTGDFIATAQDFRYLLVLGQNGNVGRNTFNNPGSQIWAMSIQREFKLPFKRLESQAFLVRMEAFNPFNHANQGGGEGSGVPSVSGNINSPNFLNSAITSVGGRSVKFYLRYSF